MSDYHDGSDPWRSLGKRLATLRKLAGYTQERFAAHHLIHYGRSTIANVERGRQRVGRDFWQACDIALSADGRLVTEYDAKSHALATKRLNDLDSIGTGRGRAAFARAAGPPTRMQSSAMGEPRRARRHSELPSSSTLDGSAASTIIYSHTSDAALEWVDRVRHGIANPARYADVRFVEAFRLQLETAKSIDGCYGAGKALSTATGVVDVVQAVASDASETIRDELLALGAEAAEFIGWLFRDLTDPAQATHWYDRAMEYAQMCGDMSMQGFVLLRKSQMAYESRSGHRVRLLARAAIEGPWRLAPGFHAEALLQIARGNLMVGQSVDLEDAVQQAREIAAGEDLTFREASCWIEAGEPDRAAQLYEDGLAEKGISVRDVGYFRARQSMALAQAAVPDLAAQSAHQALSLSVQTGSRRTHRAVQAARAALTPWQSREAIAVLDHGLMAHELPIRRQLQ